MKLIIRLLTISSISIFFNIDGYTQNAPIGSLPMMYNGGFAGEAGAPRISTYTNFRIHTAWHAPEKDYGQFISYDNFFKQIRTGIGVTAGHFWSTGYQLYNFENTSLSIALSPKFSHKGKSTFAPFVDFTFIDSHTSLDTANWFIPGTIFLSNFMPHNYRAVLRGGFLYNWKHAYIGLSGIIQDVNKENESVVRFNPRAGVFERGFPIYLQAGYTFESANSKFSFTPQVTLCRQRFRVFFPDISLAFRYKNYLAGLNRAGLMIGYQRNRIRIQVTQYYKSSGKKAFVADLYQDPTTAMITPVTVFHRDYTYYGTLSIRYFFKNKPKF